MVNWWVCIKANGYDERNINCVGIVQFTTDAAATVLWDNGNVCEHMWSQLVVLSKDS